MKHYWSSSSFSRKKKRGQKIQGVKGVFLSITSSSSTRGLLFLPRFVLLCYRATIIKGCIISTVALSLSRARESSSSSFRVFWSVDAKETTTTPTVAERYPETKTISIIHTQIRSIASQNRTPKRSLLWTPKRPPRKKKISNTNASIDWHSHPYLLWDVLDALRNRRRRQSRRSHHHHHLLSVFNKESSFE